MNCSTAQERFADLLDGRLPEAGSADVRTHLASCPDCQREYAALNQTLAALDALPAAKPGPALRKNFYAMLEEEKNSAASVAAATFRQRRAHRASLWRWILIPAASGALALAAFMAGTRYAPAPVAAPAVDAATKAELAALRKQVDSVNQLVNFSLLQQRSTSDRLQSVLANVDKKNPSPKVISDLIGLLALDPSTNVRLSALDALYPHADQEVVRSSVLATLPRDPNPLVQVAMIDFLVAARDRDAAPELERMSRNELLDRAVRDAAKRGLAQL
jgi:hypothetical protein